MWIGSDRSDPIPDPGRFSDRIGMQNCRRSDPIRSSERNADPIRIGKTGKKEIFGKFTYQYSWKIC